MRDHSVVILVCLTGHFVDCHLHVLLLSILVLQLALKIRLSLDLVRIIQLLRFLVVRHIYLLLMRHQMLMLACVVLPRHWLKMDLLVGLHAVCSHISGVDVITLPVVLLLRHLLVKCQLRSRRVSLVVTS